MKLDLVTKEDKNLKFNNRAERWSRDDMSLSFFKKAKEELQKSKMNIAKGTNALISGNLEKLLLIIPIFQKEDKILQIGL